MSSVLVFIVTLLYVWTAIALITEGKPGMALCFFGYATANVGILWSLRV